MRKSRIRPIFKKLYESYSQISLESFWTPELETYFEENVFVLGSNGRFKAKMDIPFEECDSDYQPTREAAIAQCKERVKQFLAENPNDFDEYLDLIQDRMTRESKVNEDVDYDRYIKTIKFVAGELKKRGYKVLTGVPNEIEIVREKRGLDQISKIYGEELEYILSDKPREVSVQDYILWWANTELPEMPEQVNHEMMKESIGSEADKIKYVAGMMTRMGYKVVLEYGTDKHHIIRFVRGDQELIQTLNGGLVDRLIMETPNGVDYKSYILYWANENSDVLAGTVNLKYTPYGEPSNVSESISDDMIRTILNTADDAREEGLEVEISNTGPYISVMKDGVEDIYFSQGEDATNLLDEVPARMDAEDYILWWVYDNIYNV